MQINKHIKYFLTGLMLLPILAVALTSISIIALWIFEFIKQVFGTDILMSLILLVGFIGLLGMIYHFGYDFYREEDKVSSSRTKQIAQKRKTKTKKNGNGTKLSYAKNKKMRRGSKLLTGSISKKRGK